MERKSCPVLDPTPEQMAALQRENHRGDIIVLRLKSPLKDTNSSAGKDKVFFLFKTQNSLYSVHCVNTLCKDRQMVSKKQLFYSIIVWRKKSKLI